ncbi:TolC family protein [uncultured Polaribacter sp.]|uniref:TolC family protein n=1 Tax=uncultured Polaribacter sp. TaxID=174711 RepID=UPI00261A5FFF|nr:TolC family protein [uncultured Polaribacter sp.]
MKTKIILFAAFFSALNTFSQKKWTLRECVDQALEKNISIQQNKLSLELAKKDVAIAEGNFLPNLNASTGGNLNFGSGFDPVSQNRVTTSIFGGSVALSAGYTVFNGFRNTNTYKQAELGIESSLLDLQKIENDISLFVVNGYLNVLFAKENLSAVKIQYEISKKQIEAADSRFKSGVIAKGELLNTQSTAATNLQNVITQENALDIALLNLAQLLQVSVENFDIAPLDVKKPTTSLIYANSSSVYEKSLEIMPEITRAKLAIENADLDIKISESFYMPSISASAGLSTNYGYNLKSGPDTPFFNQLDDNLGYGVGFNISIPIFNRFQTKNNVAKSKINKNIFETRLESEKLALKQTIEQAFLDVKTALKTYEAAEISLQAQQEAFKNAQERYNFGAVTLFDFDQVRTRLVNAQATMIRSKYDAIFKTKVLQFYTGELVLE